MGGGTGRYVDPVKKLEMALEEEPVKPLRLSHALAVDELVRVAYLDFAFAADRFPDVSIQDIKGAVAFEIHEQFGGFGSGIQFFLVDLLMGEAAAYEVLPVETDVAPSSDEYRVFVAERMIALHSEEGVDLFHSDEGD